MQEKLLMGGQLMDKAAKQEYELRQAHIELEERRRTEMELARELEVREIFTWNFTIDDLLVNVVLLRTDMY